VSDFHANPRFDPLPYAHADVGAEQKQLQDAVYAGANAYQPDVSADLSIEHNKYC
jgi:hypothetical protein